LLEPDLSRVFLLRGVRGAAGGDGRRPPVRRSGAHQADRIPRQPDPEAVVLAAHHDGAFHRDLLRLLLIMWLALVKIAAVAGLIGVAIYGISRIVVDRPPLRVGVLHSLTGNMAISERSLVDAVTLSVEEINGRGGLLGRPIEVVAADGRSDPDVFAR